MKRSIMLLVALLVGCTERRDPVSPVHAPSERVRSSPTARNTTFSGQATAVRATVLGTPIVLSDAGPLPPSGGAAEASLVTASVPGVLTADVLHASAVAQGNASRSEASVADLQLTAGGNTVSASFLDARATATCSSGQATVSGSSEIVALAVNGQSVAVSGSPNQSITLPGGRVIINEQIPESNGITVNALHLIVDGVADVIISSAHADITCGQTCPPSIGDFVTGGGWIVTPSGAKGNFGVAGGLKNGALWGHLTYIDHGPDLRIKGTGVTGYEVVDATTRRITGTAEVNGQSGFTYEVTVSDNGEPGRADRFTIRLSNGYSASGTLGGGNIQLHKPDTCS